MSEVKGKRERAELNFNRAARPESLADLGKIRAWLPAGVDLDA